MYVPNYVSVFHQTQQNLAAQKGGYKSVISGCQKKSSGQGEIFFNHARKLGLGQNWH